jgi:hypothetical protein
VSAVFSLSLSLIFAYLPSTALSPLRRNNFFDKDITRIPQLFSGIKIGRRYRI